MRLFLRDRAATGRVVPGRWCQVRGARRVACGLWRVYTRAAPCSRGVLDTWNVAINGPRTLARRPLPWEHTGEQHRRKTPPPGKLGGGPE